MSGHDKEDRESLQRQYECQQEIHRKLSERERAAAAAEAFHTAVSLVRRLHPELFSETQSELSYTDSDSSKDVPLAEPVTGHRSARIAARNNPITQPPTSVSSTPVEPTPSTLDSHTPDHTMPDVTSLPSRRNKSAPVFDPENPRSLL
ncbi:hypothetical protein OE88DRAFT_1738383 [Heliocybe sulcata]|uniref:Uncharacterized protein n=1 Tax=Heliocybe sulcata TaxID=5364 RepID=A0A5C3N2A6_9AGAM|nr:hypothetical protein OE88DRAFT_1738383 [Heliocybe sulcata]